MIAAPYNGILIRYGEIALKKKNRPFFEQCLLQNIERIWPKEYPAQIKKIWGRLLIPTQEVNPQMLNILHNVFGIASFSPVVITETKFAAIEETAKKIVQAYVNEHKEQPILFRVSASRDDKSFSHNSVQLNRELGHLLLEQFPQLKVNLEQAALNLGIDVRHEGTYLFAEEFPGLRGLPVGCMGKVVVLLSGGIDSPVAAYLAMKRGCLPILVSFHSYPFIGQAAIEKVKDLAKQLTKFFPNLKLYLIPFAEMQKTIKSNAPAAYRTVLYRRMMLRIAQRIAHKENAKALITGDSIGQVASQTLENLQCIDAVTQLPVLRPLVAYDKLDTIELAKRIGTFAISIRPEQDCCSLFQPQNPVTHGTLEACLEAEKNYSWEELDGAPEIVKF